MPKETRSKSENERGFKFENLRRRRVKLCNLHELKN